MENPFRHKIVVHGSSITHGIAAGRAGMAYSSRLGRDTGLYCINLGFSGQCTMQPEFASYLSRVEADAFVFDCFSNPSAEVINERFDAFVDTIRRTHPTTPLIFLQTIRRETRNFSTRIEKFEREKQAAAEAQVRDRMKTDKTSISSIRAICWAATISPRRTERIRPISDLPTCSTVSSRRSARYSANTAYANRPAAGRKQRRRSEDSGGAAVL
ncbi:MAG: SGNH/GDSL hydrolase family protein [Alistipes finegoldii]